MNKTKLYDFSLFNNEYDILDLRLKYMKNFVDKFFVCEINITYQSGPSEFYSKHFIENYPIAKELISEGRLEFVSLNLEPDSVYFGVETAHRIEFSKWVKTNVQEDYVGILCDCDEIVSDHVVNVCDDLNFIMCLEMKLFYFAADNWSYAIRWRLPKLFRKAALDSHDFKMIRNYDQSYYIPEMGWHFSCFGGIQQVIDKIKSFSHTEYNNGNHTNPDIMSQRIKNKEDFLGRCEYPCKEWNLDEYPNNLKNLILEKPNFTKMENLLS